MTTHQIETEEMKWEPLPITATAAAPKPAGRLVIKYLQENKEGATATEILKYLRLNHAYGNNVDEMNRVVESLLENGTALGFLERKGSHYSSWYPREAKCGRRRKSRRRRSCCRRRRRCKIRRRRSRRRRRRRRC